MGAINQAIRRGRLPATDWGNWRIKWSDLLVYPIAPGKGSAQKAVPVRWGARADAFILRMKAEGKTWAAIARMMKKDESAVGHHGRYLVRKTK